MRELRDVAQHDGAEHEARRREHREHRHEHVPVERGQKHAGHDDRQRGAERGHGAHDAHVGAQLLARGHLERDVHADGDEQPRAERLHDASRQQDGEARRQRADDAADHQQRHSGHEQRTGGHAAVGERRHRHHDGCAQHVGRGKPLHGGHVHAQVCHDRRERHVEERLVERGEERGERRHRHDGRGFAKCCSQSRYLLFLPTHRGAGTRCKKRHMQRAGSVIRSCTVIRFTCRKAPHVSFAIPLQLFEALVLYRSVSRKIKREFPSGRMCEGRLGEAWPRYSTRWPKSAMDSTNSGS